MNIGIDIDGVLVDQRKFMIAKGIDFFKRKPVNKNTLDIEEMFGCSKKEGKKFWAKYLIEYSTKIPVRKDAPSVINQMKNSGNKIYFITSRVFSTDNNILGTTMRLAVKNYLKKNDIMYDDVIFCDEDKMDAISRYNITVMIEDDVENIKKMSQKIEVINFVDNFNYLDIPFNMSNSRIAYNWRDVQSFLEKLACKYNALYNGDKLETRPELGYYPLFQTLGEIKEEKMYDFMFARNKFHMNSKAINYFGAKITYKDLSDKIDECCNALISLGVKKGDVVSICMPNTPEALITFYAINKIGAIAHMIHPLKSQNEIKDYINETNSELLFMFDANYEKVKNILSETELKNVVVCSAADSMPLGLKIPYVYSLKKENLFYQEKPSDVFINWTEFMKNGKDFSHKKAEYESNGCAVLLHTGGSSGKSKTVMLSDHNFNSMVGQFIRNIDNFARGDSLAAVMPIFHGFGLCSSIHLPLSLGVTVDLIPKFDVKNCHKLLKDNHIIGVPTMMRAFKKSDKIKTLENVKTFTAGGEGVSKEEELENRKFLYNKGSKAEYSKGYGLTESVAGVTYAFGKANEISSCGIPSVFTELKIFEPNTENELSFNEIGEICISGPTNMLGYFKDDEATKKVLRQHQDGKVWLHTRDLGRMTPDGQLFYVQRYDRMFISSGVNVYPQIVEAFVLSLGFVDKCCFVPVSHEYKGKVGKLFVVLKPNNNMLEDEIFKVIQDKCQENLDKYHQPVDIEIYDELPLTDVSKVNYKELERIANERAKSLKKEL